MDKEPSISNYQQEHIEEKIQEVWSFKETRIGLFFIKTKETSGISHVGFVDVLDVFTKFIHQKCYEADEQWHSLGVKGKPDIEEVSIWR